MHKYQPQNNQFGKTDFESVSSDAHSWLTNIPTYTLAKLGVAEDTS